MENSLEQKNRNRKTSKQSGLLLVFFFLPLLLNLEGKAAFFPVLSKVKCLIKWKRFKVTHK